MVTWVLTVLVTCIAAVGFPNKDESSGLVLAAEELPPKGWPGPAGGAGKVADSRELRMGFWGWPLLPRLYNFLSSVPDTPYK